MPEPTPPCCEAWPAWADFAAWYAADDDPRVLLMPHLAGTHHRFNFCPSCGAERRSAVTLNDFPTTSTDEPHLFPI